jgi:hypothetical protein
VSNEDTAREYFVANDLEYTKVTPSKLAKALNATEAKPNTFSKEDMEAVLAQFRKEADKEGRDKKTATCKEVLAHLKASGLDASTASAEEVAADLNAANCRQDPYGEQEVEQALAQLRKSAPKRKAKEAKGKHLETAVRDYLQVENLLSLAQLLEVTEVVVAQALGDNGHACSKTAVKEVLLLVRKEARAIKAAEGKRIDGVVRSYLQANKLELSDVTPASLLANALGGDGTKGDLVKLLAKLRKEAKKGKKRKRANRCEVCEKEIPTDRRADAKTCGDDECTYQRKNLARTQKARKRYYRTEAKKEARAAKDQRFKRQKT